MVDFGKKLGKGKRQSTIDPRAIYDGLDLAVDVGPLRPAQVDVLTQWHEKHRHLRDVILKLHTGQGKTLVGLLMLQSRLNASLGPCLYLCPNRYLVEQTRSQAQRFGIDTCTSDGELPQDFLEGKTILVTTVKKLFNGLTKFGLGKQAIPVKSVVVDDAHASIDDVRDSFRIKLPNDHKAYQALLALFHDALARQGPGTLNDIKSAEHDAFLLVPYWEWMSFQDQALEILSNHKQDNCIKFQWPLLKDSLAHCHCTISGSSIEIEPYLPPIELIGSFARSEHRIFMSATTADDSFLLKGLRISSSSILEPLVHKEERWSGEKMILLPSVMDEDLDRSTIVNWLGVPVEKRMFGVVALVPSNRLTKDWEACGATIANTDTSEQEIKRLSEGDYSRTLVLVNRYDGIDLPDKMCRILILDSRPYADALYDRYADQCRANSSITLLRITRKIEQGLGRSVRGEKDYSAILLVGDDLTRLVRSEATRNNLSKQTAAQIDIGMEVAELAKAEIADGTDARTVLRSLINQCLRRDQDWKEFYADRMDAVEFGPSQPSALEILQQELASEIESLAGRPEAAERVLQKLLDQKVKEDEERGWYLQEIARYQWVRSRVDSEKTQVAAQSKNHLLLRPRSGDIYVKLAPLGKKRVEAVMSWLGGHGSYEAVRLEINETVSDLALGVAADRFESAIQHLGEALGFGSQRPEKEFKEGPDNLWILREGEYVVIECKNDVGETRAEISKSEAGQMNTSMAWFGDRYPGSKAKYLMFHPAGKAGTGAHFSHDILVCRKTGLKEFRTAVTGFFAEFKTKDLKDLTEGTVHEALAAHGLTDGFLERFSKKVT